MTTMTTHDALARYRRNFQDEIDSAAQYRAMAESEREERTAGIYRELAAMEEKHAAFWVERLRKANAKVPSRVPSWRARVLSVVARRLGAGAVLPTIAGREYKIATCTAGSRKRKARRCSRRSGPTPASFGRS
jgi:hypothetical protein